VVQQSCTGIAPAQRDLERLDGEFLSHVFAGSPTADLAGEHIDHQGQVVAADPRLPIVPRFE
jgi:hypothetical protein